MKARGLLLLAAVAVAVLAFLLRGDDRAPRDADRTRTQEPEKRPEPAEATALDTLERSLELHEAVEGARVFVRPMLRRGTGEEPDFIRRMWSLEIPEFQPLEGEEFKFRVAEDVLETEVLVVAPGCIPSVEGYGTDTEYMDVELEKGTPTTIEVLDEFGKPFEGADLHVFASDYFPPHERHVTGPTGKVDVILNKHGHVHVSAPGRTREEATRKRTRVQLWPAFALAGRVVDSSGAAIAGAVVTLQEGAGDVVRSSFRPQVLSGADGSWRFEHISNGRCEVWAWKEGHIGRSDRGWPGRDDVVLTLYKPATLSGRVVGAPKDYVWERDMIEGRGPPFDFDGDVVEADGTFTMVNLRPGPMTILVRVEDKLGKLPVFVTEGANTTGLKVVLKPYTTRVRVRVLGPDGRPRAGARVWTDYTDEVRTDGAGEAQFAYQGDADDRVTVNIAADGLVPHREAVFVRDGPGRGVDVVRIPEPVDAIVDVEPRQATLDVWHRNLKTGYSWIANSDPTRGRYVLRVNPTLEYRLRLETDEGDRKLTWRVPPDRKSTVRLEPAGPARLVLKLTDESGALAENVIVRARSRLDRWKKGKRHDDGTYRIDDLRPATLTITAGRDANVPEVEFEVTLRGGEERKVEKKLPGYRWLHGFVRDERGKPVSGAAIVIVGTGIGYSVRGENAATHPDGSFRMLVAKGSRKLAFVRKDGFGRVAIDLAAEEANVILQTAGELVLEGVPARIESLRFGLRLPMAGGGHRFFPRVRWPDAGLLLVDRLPPGPVVLRFADGTTRTYEIRAGKTTRAAFR